MTSYLRYKQQIRIVQDADDDIESWITVRGNHIPIRKGQSKEEAVKSFIESKSKGDGGKHYITTKQHGDTRYVNPKNYEIVRTKSEVKPFGSKAEAQSFAHKLNHTDPYAGTPFATKNYERKQFPYEVESEEEPKSSSKADKNRAYYARWSAGQEPHTLKTEQIEKDLNAYRQMRTSKPDDNELLDKIHDLSDELKLRKNIEKTKPESKYDPDFEIVRKGALANYYLYGGKYTQKSKAEAYKEWKYDTSSEENLRKANKWVNSELVDKKDTESKKRETYTTAEGFEFYKDTNEMVKKGGYTLADKNGNIIMQANFIDNTNPKKWNGWGKKDKQPASVEKTEKAIEQFFTKQTEANEAKGLAKEHKLLKQQVANIEKVLEDNRRKQKNIPTNAYTFSNITQLRKEEEKLIKDLRKAQNELSDFEHYELV